MTQLILEEIPSTYRMTKKQNKKAASAKNSPQNNGMRLRTISPLTKNQEQTFESYYNDQNLFLHGSAGTGKTFSALYLALDEIMNTSECPYKKIFLIRSVVPTRDMGFLPGSAKEKAKAYEAPYYAICTELFGRGDAYEILKNKGIIEFMTTSFIRGVTLSDCIVIVDETQNLSFEELDSVLTRVGNNCKIIFAGDFRQSDFKKDSEKYGILDFMKIIRKIKQFDLIEFNRDDIVRSSLVKSYIIAKEDLHIKT